MCYHVLHAVKILSIKSQVWHKGVGCPYKLAFNGQAISVSRLKMIPGGRLIIKQRPKDGQDWYSAGEEEDEKECNEMFRWY